MLAVAPGNGSLYNENIPDGLRNVVFGQSREGKVTYLLLDDQREVHLLRLLWIDLDDDDGGG